MTSSLDEARLADTAAMLNVEEQFEVDEQEDWEYEYSTTETEVRPCSVALYLLCAAGLPFPRHTIWRSIFHTLSSKTDNQGRLTTVEADTTKPGSTTILV
jgi:hypothetical protein